MLCGLREGEMGLDRLSRHVADWGSELRALIHQG
jgi:hypothetical protein